MKIIDISTFSSRDLLRKMISLYSINPRCNNYLVLCSRDKLLDLLTQATLFDAAIQRPGFLSYYSDWLIYVPITIPPDLVLQYCHVLRNVAVISGADNFTHMNIDTFIESHVYVLRQYVHRYIYGDLTGNNYMITVPHGCMGCPLFDVHSALQGESGPVLELQAYWTQAHSLVMMADIYPRKKYGFNGKHLLVGTKKYNTFVYKNSTSGLMDGFCMHLLRELARTLNFTYTLIERDTDGSQDKDGNWTGLLGVIQRKEVDLVMAPLAMTGSRLNAADFSYPFFMDHVTVLYKRIDPKSMKWRLYIEPFKYPVWMSYAFCVILVGFLISWISKRSHICDNYAKKKGLARLKHAMLFAYGSVMQQGCPKEPKAWSGRFVVGFWWICVVVMAAVYNGNLISFLTVSIEFLPFENIQGMVDGEILGLDSFNPTAFMSRTFSYGFLSGSVYEDLYTNTNVSLYQKMWQQIQGFAESDPTVMDPHFETHMHKIRHEDYAFVGDQASLRMASHSHCGEVMVLPEKLWPLSYSIAMPKGSSYVQLFSQVLLQMQESGLIDTLERKYLQSDIIRCGMSTTLANPVDMEDMQGPLVLIGICLFVCIIVFFIELIHYKRMSAKLVTPRPELSADTKTKDKIMTPELTTPVRQFTYTEDAED